MNKTGVLIALVMPYVAFAEQARELGAHEHGHSALNIAVEGTQVAMELEAPGADITGFEYRAETVDDRAKLDAAIAALSDPLALFVLPSAAGCTVVEVDADLMGDHHEEHEDHSANEDDHDHDSHGEDEGAEHTEFHAEYLLNCTDPSAITSMDFAFFETFPNAEEVEVQLISDKGAHGFDVERDAPVLNLSGLI